MKTAAAILTLLLCLPSPARPQEFGGVRYLGQFTPPSGGSYTAGCWGWTDTLSGREYAILGNQCGTAIVEVTNVAAMVERDFVPGPCSSWREIAVHRNYAYVVSEAGGGTQIIDLSYLPDSVHLVKSFTHTSGVKNTSRAHTVGAHDGHLYLNGCANWSPGGILIFDLADPENPLYRGEYAGTYIHDSFVKNDTIFGAAIYGTGIVLVDATVKTAPVPLYTIGYAGAGTHNLATTADGAYILSTDEIGSTAKTLKIWDRATSVKVAEYAGSPTAIVHNVFVREDLAIMSYYTAGIRVVDLTDPADPVEVGGYDTYAGDAGIYDGAWSVYPFFPSGKIIIGDMASGMYVVEVNVDAPLPPAPFSAYSDHSTPTSIELTWTDPTEKADGSPLSDFVIHVYRGNAYIAEVDSGVGTYVDPGRTTHVNYTYSIRAVTATDSSNVITASAWAGGHAQPKPPTSFTVADVAGGNLLSWVNPSLQIDDTPLNDLAWVLIHRDGALFDSVAQTSADTAQPRDWTDTSGGYHTYHLRVRDDESPVNYSAVTPTASGFGGLFTSLSESFDSALVAFQVTGSWDTTSTVSASAPHSLTDTPAGPTPPSSTSSLVTPRVALGPDPILRFKHIAIVPFQDIAWVEISANNRVSWTTLKVYNMVGHPLWTDSTADPGDWEEQVFDLHAYEGDSVNIRFRLVTNSTVQGDGWYIDDLYIGTSQEAASVAVTAEAGWNLVSLPVLAPDPSAAGLLPGALTPAYRYDNGYLAEDTIENGSGYWVKFAGGDSLTFDGLSVLRDTIDVQSGWNLVGSVASAVNASAIASIPPGIIESQVYGYSAGYAAASSLQPGHAYWLKVSQSGKIVLSAFQQGMAGATVPVAAGEAPSGGGADPAEGPDGHGTLTLTDASGASRTLTLASRAPGGVPAAWHELPPTPPAGSFDVRFSSQRSLEVFDGPAAVKGIEARDARYPITVSWRLPAGAAATLEAGTTSRTISGSGSLTLGADPGALGVGYGIASADPLPAVFELGQNYPNPFNPSTTIDFRLASPGTVRLEVYNTLGQKVASLAEGAYPAGSHAATWDAGATGDAPGGVYHARLSVSGERGETLFTASRKLLLVK